MRGEGELLRAPGCSTAILSATGRTRRGEAVGPTGILSVAYYGDQARRALKLVLSFPRQRQKLFADDLSVLHRVNANFQ